MARSASAEGASAAAGLRKRSLVIAGHSTSLALEREFWAALEAMAAARSLSLAGLIGRIDGARGERALASACRVAALAFATGEGAGRAC